MDAKTNNSKAILTCAACALVCLLCAPANRTSLCQNKHVNYTHTTVNHTNKKGKKAATAYPKRKTTTYHVTEQSTRKCKSYDQGNLCYNHNSPHDKKINPYLDSIASYNKEINKIKQFISHVVLTQYRIQISLQVLGDREVVAIQKEVKKFHDLDMISPINMKTRKKQQKS